MKRIVFIITLTLLFAMLPYAIAYSQAAPAKMVVERYPNQPSDGFVMENKAEASISTEYYATGNILIGPGYSEDGFGLYFGYAQPLFKRLYLIGMAKYGEMNENEEIDFTGRGYLQLTSMESAFNVGILISTGPLFEKLKEGAEAADIGDWAIELSVGGGLGLTYSISQKFALVGGYEYQTIASDFGKSFIHRGFLGINYLM